ncbi:MAG: DUF4118 domain-containing protein [Planctomycetaceae bacterium]
MTDSNRPSPEQMLARLKTDRDEATAENGRGKLNVFFGYAAGVGKTYAMLLEARRLAEAGTDVVIGYVEPHGRPETEALLEGLEVMPSLEVPYRGTLLREFDLDAALSRKPEVILVDELAHTNPPSLRHVKRWQDIEELLAAGINVDTTCNVQHVESLNDVIAQVSGIVVRETVPDDVINRADELTLIDVTPENLLERLREGKVYIPAQAERALKNFFRRENLLVLRELALRRAAERVHADVQTARTGSGTQSVWATGECLLVCVGPSPTSAKVIRAAKRLSNSLRADLVAVHVENTPARELSPVDRKNLADNLRLANRLGAEIVTLIGDDLVQETLDYAHRRNVTKIVIGKSQPSPRKWARTTSLTDRIIRDSGNIDVYVVRGTEELLQESRALLPQVKPARAGQWLATAAVLAATTGLAWFMDRIGLREPNIIMVFLLAVVITSFWFGRALSIVASFLSVLLFDIFFTEPYYTLVVHDTEYLITFFVMLSVALTISTLTTSIHRQAGASRLRELRTDALYRLGRKLTGIVGRDFLAAETERVLSDVFGCESVVFLPEQGKVRPIIDHPASFAANETEVAVAQWVLNRGQPAGRGTDTLPSAQAFYLPLASPEGPLGVLGIKHDDLDRLLLSDSRSLLEAFASLLALALERDRLTLEAHDATLQAKTQELRSALLSSVSHDIRTPLAIIAGASSSLIEGGSGKVLDEDTRQELLSTIFEESDRLTRLVENLLRLTRLNSGQIHIEKDWHPVDDVVGSALHRLRNTLGERTVHVRMPEELLMGQFDAVLLEQVLMNLLENAARYTPPESPITIGAEMARRGIAITIEDRGPGIPPDELNTIFEAFQRGSGASSHSRGAGLGLAICRAIVQAHGGTITAGNAREGGAVFRVWLPVDERPEGLQQTTSVSTEADS